MIIRKNPFMSSIFKSLDKSMNFLYNEMSFVSNREEINRHEREEKTWSVRLRTISEQSSLRMT